MACQPAHATMALSSVVPGFIGDTSLRIAETYGPADGDVLFLADQSEPDFDIDGPEAADLRIVDLTGILEGHEGFVTGVCELNRKPLVRGAKRAAVPDALTLLAGMDGMERGLALPPADTPTGDALPDSMAHAAELAAASPFLKDVLPAQTLHAYLTRSPN